ncbi:phosphoribosylformylglycinamidine cyclo-ligase [Methanothermobacter marburgensis]|uniref:Phosphoribosylformylglycinamidine cyclo-ligase n=1 Tax=Methanothermobacter marburgensis (strain ATCC BAA-927 / DSM 2133 / JCM 14651 / NBRC 100331 / OCM 82 / Marburg) TaxID=79929 RepID=D9PY63_METTM|nr:phosphoribosylformylglycinamidine cyclo-ligase [Methanothermobacter marburgensis]ADL59161.1 phosphoribosylformylglycinamidine cyclo-ligase [Methanothermobacter marburgensis str. Marburg]WBF09672.1 phosphoribosylformylglycinamidine cyclo-ligase [Methanothermobacter marburgensis]
MVTYSESGVDIDLEELTVSRLTSRLKGTLRYCDVISGAGHFAALVRMGDVAIAMSTDGVGSKILVAEMMSRYDTVGIDCIAMVVNDILCVGAKPAALVDYLAVEEPDPDVADEIGKGLARGAEIAQVAIIGGETASLPGIIRNLDLAATGIGFVDVDRIITGENVGEGDAVIGLESSGIHSNGLSLARKVFFDELKLSVNDEMPGSAKTVGEELLEPTRIYVDPIMRLLESGVSVHGLAHITGGGFGNLKRLNRDVGYHLDSLPEPQEIFRTIHEAGVDITEMYRVFNMGVGFCAVVSHDDLDDALDVLGDGAHHIGNVTPRKAEVALKTYTGESIKL